MDNTREELINLLCKFSLKQNWLLAVANLADYLIANGVTVQPTPTNEDRCVCCGAIIPEGQMVCPNCLVAVKEGKNGRNNVPL